MSVPKVVGLENVHIAAPEQVQGANDSVDLRDRDVPSDQQQVVEHIETTSIQTEDDVPEYEKWFRQYSDITTSHVAGVATKDAQNPQNTIAPFEPLAFIRDNLPKTVLGKTLTGGLLVGSMLVAGKVATSNGDAPTATKPPKTVVQGTAPNPLTAPNSPFVTPSSSATSPAEVVPALSPSLYDCSKLAVQMAVSGSAEVGVIANLKNGKQAYITIPNDIKNVAKKNAQTRHPGISYSGSAGFGVCLPKGIKPADVFVQNGDTLQINRAAFISLLVLPKNVSADPKAKNREQIDTLAAPIAASSAPTITAKSLQLINSELAPKGALRKSYVAKVAESFIAAMGQDISAKQNKVVSSFFDARLYALLKKANAKFNIVFVNTYVPPSAQQITNQDSKLSNVQLISLDATAQILKKGTKS